jgi:hypothetical protein
MIRQHGELLKRLLSRLRGRFRKVVEKIVHVSPLTGRSGLLRAPLPQAKESSHVNPSRFSPCAGPARG